MNTERFRAVTERHKSKTNKQNAKQNRKYQRRAAKNRFRASERIAAYIRPPVQKENALQGITKAAHDLNRERLYFLVMFQQLAEKVQCYN